MKIGVCGKSGCGKLGFHFTVYELLIEYAYTVKIIKGCGGLLTKLIVQCRLQYYII